VVPFVRTELPNHTDALAGLLRSTSSIFNANVLYELASKGMPSFAETMRDAKTDLDSALRSACEALIQNAASNVAAPLRAFLGRCSQFLSTPTADGLQADLPGQAWASAEAVRGLHDSFVAQGEGLEKALRDVLAKMGAWLDDPEAKTVGVLVPPLQVSWLAPCLPILWGKSAECLCSSCSMGGWLVGRSCGDLYDFLQPCPSRVRFRNVRHTRNAIDYQGASKGYRGFWGRAHQNLTHKQPMYTLSIPGPNNPKFQLSCFPTRAIKLKFSESPANSINSFATRAESC
jgi:hypothetical protein